MWMEQLEKDVRRPMRQESRAYHTRHVKGKIHNMIVQPAMLYGMETMRMTSPL